MSVVLPESMWAEMPMLRTFSIFSPPFALFLRVWSAQYTHFSSECQPFAADTRIGFAVNRKAASPECGNSVGQSLPAATSRNTRKCLITYSNFGMLRDIVFGLCPSHARYVLAPVIALRSLSCRLRGRRGRRANSHFRSTSRRRGDAQSLPPSLPAASPTAYRLPVDLRARLRGQSRQQRRPLRAARQSPRGRGVRLGLRPADAHAGGGGARRQITLAETPSPPGSECYGGCPERAARISSSRPCCSKCLYSANKVNVQHADGVISSYSHLDEVVVAVGQKVRRRRPARLLGHDRLLDRPAPALPDHVRLPDRLLPVAADDLRRRRHPRLRRQGRLAERLPLS